MSFQHHSEGMSPEMRKLFEDEQASRQRFHDQVDRRAKRTFSEGRLGAMDDGDLAFAIGTDKDTQTVRIAMRDRIEWLYERNKNPFAVPLRRHLQDVMLEAKKRRSMQRRRRKEKA